MPPDLPPETKIGETKIGETKIGESQVGAPARPAPARPAPESPASGVSAPPRGVKRRRGRRALALLALAAGVGVGIWALVGRAPKTAYATQPVVRGDIVQTVNATGVVNPQLTITVGTYVSGVIQRLYCDYNTQVRAGQICAKIDPRPFQATFDQASAQLQRDRAILAKDEANLTRYRQLLAQDSIALQTAEDQAHVVAQDRATVKVDEAQVRAARLNLGYTDIVSPVNGTVVSRNVTQGQTVAASLQTPTLFLIATDLKKMQIDTNISEGDIGQVRPGQRATFTVDAFPRRSFGGVVTQVRKSPQTVQNVVTYDAVVTAANPDLALMPGMTASTQIVVNGRADALRAPNQALRYSPGSQNGAGPAGRGGQARGGARLWVLRDGKPAAVPVVLGLDDGTATEILSGAIKAGDQVIVSDDSKGKTKASGGGSARPAMTMRF